MRLSDRKGSPTLILRALAILALPLCTYAQDPVDLNQNCTVSILNRNAQVAEDGSWIVPNVPADFGPVRARATCVQNGATVSGQSDLFTVPVSSFINLPQIQVGDTTPIPFALTISAPLATLTEAGQSVPLTVTAKYAGRPDRDVTAASAGTTYGISNSALATVSPDGLVTALQSGTVLVQARNEGTQGLLSLHILFGGIDSDGDGIPDDAEARLALNPNDPSDALQDPDHDGLTNLQEYQLGTDPHSPDTDGDGLTDGQEELTHHTSPLLADTDGDGVPDGLEIQTGTDPLNPASYNLNAALASIEVIPSSFRISLSSVVMLGSQQLLVLGRMKDGKTSLDLTSTQRWGTNYTSSDLTVCNFGAPDGNVFSGNAGSCTITVTVAGFSAVSQGTIVSFAPFMVSWLALPGFGNDVAIRGDYAYVAAGSAGLQVVDVSNHQSQRIVASLALAGTANDVQVVGNLAYVSARSGGLQIVDVANPLAPALVSVTDTGGDTWKTVVSGGIAYVSNRAPELRTFDVSNPAAPAALGSITLAGAIKGLDVDPSRHLVVAVGYWCLYTIDVTDPAAPTLLGGTHWYTDWGTDARDVAVRGNFAFVADMADSLVSVDITNPAAPVLGTTLSPYQGGLLQDVAVAGDLAFGAVGGLANGVPIIDISAPPSLGVRVFMYTPLDWAVYTIDSATGIAVDQSYVYFTASTSASGGGNKGTATGSTRLFIGLYSPPVDTAGVPPVVAVTAPAAGSSVYLTCPIAIDAKDDSAVARVDFVVNGDIVYTRTAPPYTFEYRIPIGATSLTIGAQATDFGGNVGTAQPVTVMVSPDVTPPTARLWLPSDGATVQQKPLAIQVTATDDQAVEHVDFLINGQVVYTATSNSSSFGFEYLPPSGVTTLVLGARAYDYAGNVGPAQQVTVTVIPDTVPPTIAIVAPSNGDTVRGPFVIRASAADDVGIAHAELLVNGEVIESFQGFELGYTYMASAGVTSLVIEARAADYAGHVGTAQPITVTVAPDMPPTISIITPANGTTVARGGYLTIRVSASDDAGIDHVDFLSDDQIVSTVTPRQAPPPGAVATYQYMYLVPPGATVLTIGAQAFDSSGQMGTAQPVTVAAISDPMTAVQGRVVDSNGDPAAGAHVLCRGQGTTSAADGSFSIANLNTIDGPLVCSTWATVGGVFKGASSAGVAPVGGGTTDVGTITLSVPNSRGRDFWLINPGMDTAGCRSEFNSSVFIVSDTTANFTISNDASGFSVSGTVTPDSPDEIQLPASLYSGGEAQTVEDMGIHVIADADVSVFLSIYGYEPYLAIPTPSLGTEYFPLAYASDPSVVAVVASQNSTQVAIYGCQAASAASLDQGQTFAMQCNDVSGARVVSDKPVAVVAAAPNQTSIPEPSSETGYLSEMMFPVGGLWGTEIYSPPLGLGGSAVYRVAAAADATVVTADAGAGNVQTLRLDHGQFREISFPSNGFGGVRFNSNEPILVMQYSGTLEEGNEHLPGYPFSMQLLPVTSFTPAARFYAPQTQAYWQHITSYAVVVAPNAATGSVQLNGTPVDPSSFAALPGGEYQYAKIPVPDGQNIVTAAAPIAVYTLGYDAYCDRCTVPSIMGVYGAPTRF
jgi:hypothetical protein